ncbi:MAG TPA: hypothetical protein V6C97_27220 [Oculatellaceae cyanobacterium]
MFPSVLLPPLYPENVVDVSIESACPAICSALHAVEQESVSSSSSSSSSSASQLAETKEQSLLPQKRFASPSCEAAVLMSGLSCTLQDQERKTLEKQQQQQQQFNEGFGTIDTQQQQQQLEMKTIPQISIPLFAGTSTSPEMAASFSPASAAASFVSLPPPPLAASSSSSSSSSAAAAAASAMPDWEREARESAGAQLAQLRQFSMSFLCLLDWIGLDWIILDRIGIGLNWV